MIPRCFVSPAAWAADLVALTPSDAHHVSDVLRLGVGDAVVVCDGQGGEAEGVIAALSRDLVTVRVVSRRSREVPEWRLTLVQAVPKGDRMEWIIQKAVELGAWSVVPVMTEHGVVRLEGDRAEQRVKRWQRIAMEAAKQCRTASVMRVEPVLPLGEWVARHAREHTLVIGSLEAEARPLGDVLAGVRAQTPGALAFLVGPEGDFSSRELAAARAAGAQAASFGRRVLRVETAAVYALSVMAYELGVMAAG